MKEQTNDLCDYDDKFLEGDKVVLVKFQDYMVDKYYQWMQQESIMFLTGSEPMSREDIEELRTKQQCQRRMFIVVDKDCLRCSASPLSAQDYIRAMAGDVCCFFSSDPTSTTTPTTTTTPTSTTTTATTTSCTSPLLTHPYVGELSIMIAESNFRRKGLAREALELMMCHCAEQCSVGTFVAKLKQSNEPSVRLFENLGFHRISASFVFKEYTYEKIYVLPISSST
eukprot:GHVS01095045.1.p1 GENE.GHVS01095045.1~~GHVS01095045.1.p1  ORF type:complete len:226 (+),score=50.19 GHVS01095045.1:154-831(+)